MIKAQRFVRWLAGIFKPESGWQNIPGVEITIVNRGEDIVYREGGREYHFSICCQKHPLLLFASKYWDGSHPVSFKRLTEEERARLIPRLVAYLGCKGDPVEIRDE